MVNLVRFFEAPNFEFYDLKLRLGALLLVFIRFTECRRPFP
jgi:hypothetical protein